jgi:hypothetical protein
MTVDAGMPTSVNLSFTVGDLDGEMLKGPGWSGDRERLHLAVNAIVRGAADADPVA